MKSKKNAAHATAKLCCRVLDEKKAGDLTVLDVSEQSSITDCLVIATATSAPHLRALRVELEKALDAEGVRILGMEAAQESGWLVIDLFDVMVHLFLPATREHFGLERLWRDAKPVALSKLLPKPALARAKKTPKTKRATKAKA